MQESGEMYLETILILKNKNEFVRSIDVAKHLGFSKPSVSRGVGILKAEGYIVIDDNGHINLTDKGNQKAKYVVPTINPTTTYVTEYEQIDVGVGFKNFEQIKQYLYVEDEKELPYDIVLIDADNIEAIQNFELENSQRNYFVTSFDCYSLKKGLEILSAFQEPANLTKVLFAQEVLKEEDEYLNYLSLGYKVIWDENRIYFPIENGDASIIAENQRVAKIKFRRLSGEYKDGLIYICQEILSNEFNESQIRKTLKNIEKGE